MKTHAACLLAREFEFLRKSTGRSTWHSRNFSDTLTNAAWLLAFAIAQSLVPNLVHDGALRRRPPPTCPRLPVPRRPRVRGKFATCTATHLRAKRGLRSNSPLPSNYWRFRPSRITRMNSRGERNHTRTPDQLRCNGSPRMRIKEQR
jgi:hypothetical protein